MDISYQATSTESFETMNRHHDGQGNQGHSIPGRVPRLYTLNGRKKIANNYGLIVDTVRKRIRVPSLLCTVKVKVSSLQLCPVPIQLYRVCTGYHQVFIAHFIAIMKAMFILATNDTI